MSTIPAAVFSSSAIAPSALRVPTCASSLCGEVSALLCDAALDASPGVAIPGQLNISGLGWQQQRVVTAESGCFILQGVGTSATTLKKKDVM